MEEGGYEEIPLEDRGEDRREDLAWDSHEEETSFTKDDSFRVMRHYHEETFDEEIRNSVKTDGEEVKDFIKTVYKNPDFSKIEVFKDENGKFLVGLKRRNMVWYEMFQDGVDEQASNTLKQYLGEKIVDEMGEINRKVDNLQVEIVKLEKIIQVRENKIRELENIIQEEKNVEKKIKLLNDRLLEHNEENEKLRDIIHHSTSPQEREELQNELKNRIADGYEKLKEINILKGKLDHFNDLENKL